MASHLFTIFVYAPFHYLCTIPKIVIGRDEGTVAENVSMEMECCTIMTFSYKGIITAASDNYCKMKISHSQVTVHHIMKYLGYT